jgi:hypothetical protein
MLRTFAETTGEGGRGSGETGTGRFKDATDGIPFEILLEAARDISAGCELGAPLLQAPLVTVDGRPLSKAGSITDGMVGGPDTTALTGDAGAMGVGAGAGGLGVSFLIRWADPFVAQTFPDTGTAGLIGFESKGTVRPEGVGSLCETIPTSSGLTSGGGVLSSGFG